MLRRNIFNQAVFIAKLADDDFFRRIFESVNSIERHLQKFVARITVMFDREIVDGENRERFAVENERGQRRVVE